MVRQVFLNMFFSRYRIQYTIASSSLDAAEVTTGEPRTRELSDLSVYGSLLDYRLWL